MGAGRRRGTIVTEMSETILSFARIRRKLALGNRGGVGGQIPHEPVRPQAGRRIRIVHDQHQRFCICGNIFNTQGGRNILLMLAKLWRNGPAWREIRGRNGEGVVRFGKARSERNETNAEAKTPVEARSHP